MPDVELTVKQAAERLGITPRAVRERLATRKLKGRKVAGRRGSEWRVSADSIEEGVGRPGGRSPTEELEAANREVATLKALLEERTARMDDLRAMVGHWETRLERHEVLLQQALRMLPQAAPEETPEKRRPWWAIWRR